MTERRRRVALYGGTFDPVHAGHTAVARGLLKLFALDEVLFIPAYVAPHKRDRRVSPAHDRYAMLALATQGEERFRVSAVELNAPERPYTVETLSSFRERAGESVRLFFVMGADSWEEITTWREWERVLTLADTIVVTRPEEVGVELEKSGGPRVFLSDASNVDVSATAVRAAVEGGELNKSDALVAPAVAEYIKKYRLYRGADGTEFSDA